MGMSKLPYALLALALVGARVTSARLRWAALAAAVAPAALWNGLSAAIVGAAPRRTDVALDAGAQLTFLVDHPNAVAEVAVETLRQGGRYYAKGFVGNLGWLDTPLPQAYYLAAYAVLALALAAAARLGGARGPRLWALAAILLAAGAVFGAMYLVWSPVGGPMVDGVQGRYFLPIAMFLPLVVVGEQTAPANGVLRRWASAVALAFPLVSLLVVERAVVLRHGLKNALIPIVTVVGVQAGYLLGGAVLTETVFAWPGVGTLMVQGILARDFPLVQGCVLVVALSFVVINLAVDLVYAWLDPRIRYE